MLNKFILLLLCAAYVSAVTYNITNYIYKTVVDVQVDLDVYTPSVPAPPGGYPVVLGLHPGGFVAWGKKWALTPEELDESLKRGWVVVPIDYRLIPGVFLEDIFEDMKDAYHWVRTELIKHTPINPDSIILWGRSAGGGLATLGGYTLSPRPKAIIGLYSFCTNWTDPYAYKPETSVNPLFVMAANKLSTPVVVEFYPTKFPDAKWALWEGVLDSGKLGWLMTTHDPDFPTDQLMAKLRQFSATENVDENFPPTYLLHGMVDGTVPYSQSVQMANALKEKNIPYVLDLVEGADHAFDDEIIYWDQHLLPAFDFAQKYIDGKDVKTPKFLEI